MSQSKPKKQTVILSVAAIAILAAGALYWIFHERPLAVVGKTSIYRKDAEYRDKVVRIYFPEEKRNMGLYQLVKSARNIEILRNHGMEFSTAAIKAEYQRMLSESKDPKMLERIREVFGQDEEGFFKNFVLPNLADHHVYYEFFLMDPSVQAESFKRANEFIKLVGDKNSTNFKQIANENSVKVNQLTLSLKRGMLWDTDRAAEKNLPRNARVAKGGPVGKTAKPPKAPAVDQKVAEYMNVDTIKDAEIWYDKLIKNMNPGEVFIEPVSVGEAFVVIHYLEKVSDEEHKLEAAFFPKQDYAQWYSKEQAKVKTEIYDKTLIPKGL